MPNSDRVPFTNNTFCYLPTSFLPTSTGLWNSKVLRAWKSTGVWADIQAHCTQQGSDKHAQHLPFMASSLVASDKLMPSTYPCHKFV